MLPEPAKAGEAIKLRNSGKPYFKVSAIGGLNVRAASSQTAKIERNIPDGTIVLASESTGIVDTIGGISAEWYQIYGPKGRGYIFSGFLKPLKGDDKTLYELSLGELERRAEASSSPERKAKLFEILHDRFLQEGGGMYCEPETGMERCYNACDKWQTNKYCPNFAVQYFQGDIETFKAYLISALQNQEKDKLLRHIGSCTVGNRICFECDGGGSLPFEKKIDKLIKSLDMIDLESAKITKHSIFLRPKNNFKSKLEPDPDGRKRNYPFLEFELQVSPKGIILKNINSELMIGQSQCVIGL